jgi:hypothetical protein
VGLVAAFYCLKFETPSTWKEWDSTHDHSVRTTKTFHSVESSAVMIGRSGSIRNNRFVDHIIAFEVYGLQDITVKLHL